MHRPDSELNVHVCSGGSGAKATVPTHGTGLVIPTEPPCLDCCGCFERWWCESVHLSLLCTWQTANHPDVLELGTSQLSLPAVTVKYWQLLKNKQNGTKYSLFLYILILMDLRNVHNSFSLPVSRLSPSEYVGRFSQIGCSVQKIQIQKSYLIYSCMLVSSVSFKHFLCKCEAVSFCVLIANVLLLISISLPSLAAVRPTGTTIRSSSVMEIFWTGCLHRCLQQSVGWWHISNGHWEKVWL